MKNYTVILQGIFNEKKMESTEFKEYSKRSNANSEVHGGVVKNKYIIEENLVKSEKPNFVIIVEFPSKDAATNAFKSEEYLSIIYLRDIVFKDVKILLTK